jgi:hypothetical protein
MTNFRIILSVEADGDYVSVDRMEVELEEEGDKQAAIEAINALHLQELISNDCDAGSDEGSVGGIDSNTAVALAMGTLGVGQ